MGLATGAGFLGLFGTGFAAACWTGGGVGLDY